MCVCARIMCRVYMYVCVYTHTYIRTYTCVCKYIQYVFVMHARDVLYELCAQDALFLIWIRQGKDILCVCMCVYALYVVCIGMCVSAWIRKGKDILHVCVLGVYIC